MKRVIKAARHLSPVLGAALIGVALGIFAMGVQLGSDCQFVIAGGACEVVQWGSVWSTRSLLAGGVLIGIAFVSEWYLDEETEVNI